MQQKKYGVTDAVKLCFRYAPVAVSGKLLLEILSGALTPLLVLVVAAFINSAVALAEGAAPITPLVVNIALMAGGYAFAQISQIIIRLADKALENALRGQLRPQLILKQARISYVLLEDAATLDLITHVCGEAEKRVMAVLNDSLGIIRLGIQLFGTLSILVAHLWWMLPLFLLSAVIIAFISYKGGKVAYEIAKESINLTRKHYYLSGVLVSRETAAERTLFGYADKVNRDFSATHLRRSNMVTKEIAIEEIYINAAGLLLNAFVLIAVFALLAPLGEGSVSQGLYVSLIGALIGLVRMIAGSFANLMEDTAGHMAYMKDYTRFCNLPEAERDLEQDAAEDGFALQRLEIRDLRFRYTPQSDYVLDGVNLVMEGGKSYSLIGQNGAGKSTLTKILLGLYRDLEGEILINGKDIAAYSAPQLRALFAIVYQDFARYAVSLADNITLSRADGDFERSMQLAELSDVAAKLSCGVATPLGKIFEGGTDISGGEWQKVAIARALYRNAPIMILDEPTASLSPMMESKLYRRFAEITGGKTSLLISHRLGSTKLSDVLFVLDKGKIAETGSHDELMAKDGLYAKMFVSQRSWYDGKE